MNNLILRCGTMLLTFTLGLAGNFLLNGLGSLVERWIETPEPVLQEPYATVVAQPEVNPFVQNCGLLVVKVGNDRSLWLRNEWMGSLDNPIRLTAKLNDVFARRAEGRVYRSGLELNSDVPEEERIEKTVLIEAPRWLSYGDLSDLIEEIRATGAQPIGLATVGLWVQSIQVRSEGFTSSVGRTR